MTLFYRDDINLLFAGYCRHIQTQSIIPTDVIAISEIYYDKTLYWTFDRYKLIQFVFGKSSASIIKPKQGDKIKLSNGKDGVIAKFGRIYDEELIGIKIDEQQVSMENTFEIGSYGKISGLNAAQSQYNDLIVKCYGYKYIKDKKRMMCQSINNVYFAIPTKKLNFLSNFIQYKQNLIELNKPDIIWRSVKELKEIQILDHLNDKNKSNGNRMIKSILLSHGNRMYLSHINYNNFIFELMIFPNGDEFGTTFCVLKLKYLPLNVMSMTASISFNCDNLEMWISTQVVTLYKNGQLILWDASSKIDTEALQQLLSKQSLTLSLNIDILQIEFKNGDLLPSPIKMKEMINIDVDLSNKLNIFNKEKASLMVYCDRYWSIFLEQDESVNPSLMIRLLSYPIKVIGIKAKFEIYIGKYHMSTEQYFDDGGYKMEIAISMTELCMDIKIGIVVTEVMNYLCQRVPKQQWHAFDIVEASI